MNLSSPSLRTLCSQNPVAAAETFHNSLQAVLAELLKCEEESTQKKTPPRWRLVGIFGTAYGFYCVVEAQGRGAQARKSWRLLRTSRVAFPIVSEDGRSESAKGSPASMG